MTDKQRKDGKNENTMKTAFRAILCVLLIASFSLSASADCDTVYDWYFKKNDENAQPALDGGLLCIRDYRCLYVAPDKKDKVIYLTFDAGYENGNVGKILDALKKHGAAGNFFILENLIRRAPETVLRMRDEGHLVCNHTARHPDMSKITDRAVFNKQLTDLEKAYTALTGDEIARFYRPPQGRFTERNLSYAQDLGYTTVFWSFAYADWDNARQPDPAAALQNLTAHVHPGMILLLHPTSASNALIMDDLLTAYEELGYRFGRLDGIGK